MFTTGSKYLFGAAALALVGALFIALATAGTSIGMDEVLGAISVGYKGGVGAHLPYLSLVAFAGVAIFLGAVLSAVRDGDPESGAEIIGLDTPPATAAPQGTNFWPIITAFGAGMIVLGAVENPLMFVAGGVVLVVAAIEWALHNWTERATGDPVANQRVRGRVVGPIEVPLIGVAGVALFALAVSRLLLAVDHHAGLIIFGVVPTIAFVVAIILNARKRIPANVIALIATIGGIFVIGAGVIGLAIGAHPVERDHPSEHQFELKGQAQNSHDVVTAPEEGE